MNNLKRLPKTIHECMTIGELPTSYKVSLTYEEQLMWFCKFLESEVIPVVNNNSEVVQELKTFVENYFDNLDVQDEINAKLEDMAERGELTEIIAQYLQLAGLLCFNTKADLKGAENLADGSFAKTYGTTTYNDGHGEFYKIREILNTDVVDDDNIISLTYYNDLVAEKIPNADIESINSQITNLNEQISQISSSQMNLVNNIIYDTNATYYTQGVCYGNNLLYVYQNIDNTYGNILAFNISTYALVNTYTQVKFYHGGDLHIDGNYMYCATSGGSKLICKMDMTTQEVTEINPFSSVANFTEVIGISEYDENNLLVGLTVTPPVNSFSNYALYKLNKTTSAIENIPINVGNFNFNFYCSQSLQTNGDKLYILMSDPNMVAVFENTNTGYVVKQVYNLPTYDVLGQFTGEYEGIAKVDDTKFVLTSHCNDNSLDSYKTLKTYIFNSNAEIPELERLNDNVNTVNINSRQNIIVDKNANANVYYENGSALYPFKSINRGISYANHSPIAIGKNITVYPATYKIGTIYNSDGILNFDPTTSTTILGITTLINCNLTFHTLNDDDESSSRTVSMDKVVIDGGDIKFRQIIFNNVIDCKHTKISVYKCQSLESEADVVVFRLSDSICFADVSSWASPSYYFQMKVNSILFINKNVSDSKILKSSSVCWVFKTA